MKDLNQMNVTKVPVNEWGHIPVLLLVLGQMAAQRGKYLPLAVYLPFRVKHSRPSGGSLPSFLPKPSEC